MACFIVEDGSGTGRLPALRRVAEQLGVELHLRASFADLRSDPIFAGPDRPILLVPEDARGNRVSDVLAFAQGPGSHAHSLYIADTIDPELYKQLVRTGSAEWTSWDGLPREWAETLERLAVPAPGSGSAKIVTFVPSKGGVGTTTLALESAIHRVTRRKRGDARTAIVDLDFQGGTLADLLDIEPRFEIREIGGSPDRLDEHLIDVLTSRHSSQLDVFAGPIRRLAPGEVDQQVVFAFLDALAGRYDAILIDTPHHGLPWIDNLMQGSDAVVVTGGSTVPALKQLGATLAHLTAIGIPAYRVATAIGPCETDFLGRVTRRREIDKALPEGRRFYIRRDGATVGAAHDAGRPLMDMAPGSRIGRDIKALAEWIENETGGDVPSPAPARRTRP